MGHPDPCLVLDRVTREFGGLTAVDDVSLTIQPGERHVLIGPNGAGKTTLFNLISGELRATAGRILLFGIDVTGMAPYRRAARGVARTFQITRLFLDLTVLDNVLLACEALDRRKFTMYRPLSSYSDLMQRAENLLGEFGLSDLRQARARNLAYGDQRKLEVALSMAGRPRLLLLDEPMAGLSPVESDSMQKLLQKLDPAIAVLLIEHDIDIAFGFADKVTVLYQGKVLTEGHKDEVRGNRKVQEIYLGTGSGLQASDFRPGTGSQKPGADAGRSS
jgi:branched-chain amino acid transport system ATP-binding protein